MAATPDFSFFEVWQDNGNNIIWFKRIASPKDITNAFHSTAYFDANLLEDAVAKDPTRVFRSKIPGDWALKQILGDAAVDAYLHKHDYAIHFI